jgi:hypothetical protein
MKETTLRAHRISRMSHCRAVYMVFSVESDALNSNSVDSNIGSEVMPRRGYRLLERRRPLCG